LKVKVKAVKAYPELEFVGFWKARSPYIVELLNPTFQPTGKGTVFPRVSLGNARNTIRKPRKKSYKIGKPAD
jgi:hypothetical protein